MVDPAEVELALLNLGVNARDAMPNGGRFRVEARNLTFHPGGAASEGLIGDFVAMTLSDTGTGMTAEVLARAFEPFYTTKEVGLGSGLGLSQVYGFAKQSDGAALIESEVGQGTSITLFLPRATKIPIASRSVTCDALPAVALVRLLLVEDDDEVAEATAELLGDIGFQVVRVRDGNAALAADTGGTWRLGGCRTRSYPHPHGRGPQPGAKARAAHGPQTEIDRGAAGRGPPATGGGCYACRTRAQLRRRQEHDFSADSAITLQSACRTRAQLPRGQEHHFAAHGLKQCCN
jgi:hypothetical protein